MMRWSWNPRGFEGWDHHLGAGGIVGLVLMIILWAAIIAALVLGIRALILYSRRNRAGTPISTEIQTNWPPTGQISAEQSPGTSGAPAVNNPALLTILEERYARGEISRDEFLQRKQDLGLT